MPSERTKGRNWRRRRRPREEGEAAGSPTSEASNVSQEMEGPVGSEAGAAPPPQPAAGGEADGANTATRRRRRRRKRRRKATALQGAPAEANGGGESPAPAADLAADSRAADPAASESGDKGTVEAPPAGKSQKKQKRHRTKRGRRGNRPKNAPVTYTAVATPGGNGAAKRKTSRRGRTKFSSNWWADRWIKMLESFGHSNRLPRGRYYARTGRVVDFRVGPGEVSARVKGSRPQPYAVRIAVAPLDDRAWGRVIQAMASQAVFAARLLSGEMPKNIGEVFSSASVSLFPKMARDLKINCSCPDSANLCKHAVAVNYILAEAFDTDPFIILHLRGRSREEVIDALTRRRAQLLSEDPSASTDGRAGFKSDAGDDSEEDAGPPSTSPEEFYDMPEEFDGLTFLLDEPEEPGTALQSLGEPPTHNPSQAISVLESCYQLITQHALEAAFGREPEPPSESPVPLEPEEESRPAIVSKQVTLKSSRN